MPPLRALYHHHSFCRTSAPSAPISTSRHAPAHSSDSPASQVAGLVVGMILPSRARARALKLQLTLIAAGLGFQISKDASALRTRCVCDGVDDGPPRLWRERAPRASRTHRITGPVTAGWRPQMRGLAGHHWSQRAGRVIDTPAYRSGAPPPPLACRLPRRAMLASAAAPAIPTTSNRNAPRLLSFHTPQLL